MDPLTHGLLGSLTAHCFLHNKLGYRAAVTGALAGMAPDLDIFFPKPVGAVFSPLHRHFTHAIAFVPVGAAIVAVLLAFLFFRKSSKKHLWYASLLAFASHGLLDSATSYGTLWYWPFSFKPVAFDFLSILDPVFTVLLLCGLIISFVFSGTRVKIACLLISLSYPCFTLFQRERAYAAQSSLIESRGHSPVKKRVLPSLANALVWRSVYLQDGRYYVDAIRTGFPPTWVEGGDVPRVNPVLLGIEIGEKGQKRLDDFRRFTNGYTGIINNKRIVDLRYSSLPEKPGGIWGLELKEKQFKVWRKRNTDAFKQLVDDVFHGSRFLPLP